MIEKKETYESLHAFKIKQDKLIEEGKTQNPQIVYGLSPEGKKAIAEGRTLDVVLKELEQKYVEI